MLLTYHAEQLSFQDKFPLLVFFTCLVRFVVLPPNGLLALPADDVPDHMSTCRHAALHGFGLVDVNNIVEQIRFAVLTTKISTYDIVVICKVGFAVLASKDLV